MGRTQKSVRAGEKKLETDVTAGTSGTIRIPNYGHTVVSTANGTPICMDPPEEGVYKRISCLGITTTSVTVIVRGSTGTSVTMTKAAATQLTFAATVDMTVELLGVSSTRWLITNVFPDNVAANTTGIAVGTT